MKIAKLELENVKRVRAVEITPAPSGLTVIGGKNGQGKTSVLDAIAWALGGEKYRPTAAKREDSVLPPRLHVVLDNGVVVDRDGKNSALRVTDPSGNRAGQALLDSLVEKLALDLPKFLVAGNKEKAAILLRALGMEAQVRALDEQETNLYNRRRAVGQIADQKLKYAKEMPDYPDAPAAPVSVTDLIARQQEILLQNSRNQELRTHVRDLEREAERGWSKIQDLNERLDRLRSELDTWTTAYEKSVADLKQARTDAADLRDEPTAPLEAALRDAETVNEKVRANAEKARALEEASAVSEEYDALSADIEKIRASRRALLEGANLPLPDLTVEAGELLYRGQRWDCMSSSEQLIVAVAIVRALNPECRFVLMDKTEQLDLETLEAFGRWMEQENLQGICTRVSTGGECEILIEDGVSVPNRATWKEGTF